MRFEPQSTHSLRHSRHRGPRRGSALVEFALVVGMLIGILMGIIEFSSFGKNTLTIANATREGARAASIGKTTAEIRDRVKRFAAPLIVESPNGAVIVEVSNDKGVSYQPLTDFEGKNAAAADSLVRVRVNSPNRTITGAFGALFNRQMNASVTMRREGNVS